MPVVDLGLPTLDQSDPWIPANQALMAIHAQNLANNAQQIRNQYLAPQLKAQTGLTQAQIPGVQARTALTQEQTRLAPQTNQIAASNTLAKLLGIQQSQYRFSPRSRLLKGAQTAQGMAMIAKDPVAAQGFKAVMQNAAQRAIAGQGSGQNLGLDLSPLYHMSGLKPIGQQAQAQVAPATAGTPTTAEPHGQSLMNAYTAPGVSAAQAQASGVPASTPADQKIVKAIMDASQSAYEKKVNTSAVLNQRSYATSARNVLNQIAPEVANISKFSGVFGNIDRLAQKGKATLNMTTSPAYQQYQNFINTQGPVLSNELRRALGGQASDKEMAAFLNILGHPGKLAANHQQFINQFNKVRGILNAQDAALAQSPSQVQAGLLHSSVPVQPIASPAGMVAMSAPDGSVYHIPANNVNAAIKRGLKRTT